MHQMNRMNESTLKLEEKNRQRGPLNNVISTGLITAFPANDASGGSANHVISPCQSRTSCVPAHRISNWHWQLIYLSREL